MFDLIKDYKVVEKDGKKKRYTNFYLLDKTSGNYVQIKPSFVTDFKTLLFLAKEKE